MPSVISASDASRLLPAIPYLAGFQPRESLLVVPMSSGRAISGLRLDLGRDGDARVGASLAETAIRLLQRVPRTDGCILVVYTSAPLRSHPWSKKFVHAQLIAALKRVTLRRGITLAGAFCVGSTEWGSYDDRPARLYPLSALVDSEADVGFGPGIFPPLGDQSSGVEPPEIDAPTAERMRAAISELESSRAHLDVGGADDNDQRALLAIIGTLISVVEEFASDDEASTKPDALAALSWLLARPCFRDVALSQWSLDVDEGARTLAFNLQCAANRPGRPENPVRLLGEGPRPNPARLERARRACQQIAALTDGRARAGALSAAAWISWALGSSTNAAMFATAALETEPDHGLADIVRSMTENNYLPGWAFEKSAADVILG